MNLKSPVLEKVIVDRKHSFALKEEILPYIEIGWHFHPEYELTLFTESTGKRFLGDHTDRFGPGDLLLIGPNLPHYMRNDESYYQGDPSLRIRAVVVHFAADFLGPEFFRAPEMAPVQHLLERSGRGLHIFGKTRDQAAPMMEKLLETEGFERLSTLLNILHLIAGSKEWSPLASRGFQNAFSKDDAKRIDLVFDYMLQNFRDDIALSEVAGKVNMQSAAFCKFFKKRTGKTFSQCLNEIRIGQACKLFIEKGVSVSEACYQSGYNHLSYFNRRFKAATGYTPLEYRKRFFDHPKFLDQ